jgi:basic membrane lipoprotein Med (substrate-binding protein (PBP1-ABC) superfamily)
MVYNPNLEDEIPQDVKDAVEEAKQKIIDGELEIELPE